MTRLHGDDVTAGAIAEQREITDNIEDLVPYELVGESERLFAEHRITAHHDRVLEASAFDEILLHQRLHVLVENKSARRRELALKSRGRDFSREKLREAPLR